ncbi:TIGR03620 family F420-dependent LLM class oxidoreductase [Planotetraspora mira]|uniref:LLM class F420-dependent oxidoreductase n=1 Tax=Planotetraspora mira TaxID=58121 RepID=A0A8J3TIA3_9ACTN|nr:TIGR03620 family F420-dependent LLM class oxidoreductase [Planotetraspora mira]GII27670.1 LLM class F420-dependent oxidoreductase [Planotetraspora mira]
MDLGRAGIWSTELRLGDPVETAEAAAELDDLGWGTLWIPGLGGGDVLGDVERLLRATRTTTVATGVISIWRHDAEEIARGHAALREAYGARVLTGLGVSDPAAANGAGRPFRPVEDMNGYLDRLDHADVPLPAGERILAAMGPRLVRLGGQRTSGVHPFMVTPESTAATRESLGRGPTLAPYQAVVLDGDPGRARATARGFLGPFLTMDHYARSLRRQGFADEDLAGGGSDRLIDGVVAWGEVEAIAGRLAEHHDAGADHVALHVLRADGAFPRREWRELAPLTR